MEVILMSKFILYEDPIITIRLSEKPAAKGHIEVLPQKECTKLSDLSDKEIEHLFYGASYSASMVFEGLGAHGTNILVNENNEQLCVHVVPRVEGDGLNFLWQPKPAAPEELKEVAKKIKDVLDYDLWVEQNPEKAKAAQNKGKQKPVGELKDGGDGKVNYLLKSLRRTP